MKLYILSFFKKYLELILIAGTVIVLFIRSDYPKYGERISLMLFGTLAFYYLASGILVFLDRHRIVRSMRLIYIIGLWGVSTVVIGIMSRLHLIRNNEELLAIALLAMAATLVFSVLALRQMRGKTDYAAYRWQLQPVFLRCGIGCILGLGVLFSSPYTLYHSFGTFRQHPEYTRKAIYVYEHAEDTTAARQLEVLTDSLRRR